MPSNKILQQNHNPVVTWKFSQLQIRIKTRRGGVSDEAWLDSDGDRTGFGGRPICTASYHCGNSYWGSKNHGLGQYKGTPTRIILKLVCTCVFFMCAYLCSRHWGHQKEG